MTDLQLVIDFLNKNHIEYNNTDKVYITVSEEVQEGHDYHIGLQNNSFKIDNETGGINNNITVTLRYVTSGATSQFTITEKNCSKLYRRLMSVINPFDE
jgi:hypothetical protein